MPSISFVGHWSGPDLGPASPPSWIIVIGILATICACCISQPRQSFCGATARFRVYLMISPLLCVAEVISNVVMFLSALFYLRGNIWLACESVLPLYMYVETDKNLADPKKSQDGTQKPLKDILDSDRCSRKLLSVIAILITSIKLATLDGSSWTKALGAMFVANFVGTEAILLLSRKYNPFREGRTSSPTREGFARLTECQRTRVDDIRTATFLLNRFLITCAFFIQAKLFVFALTRVWTKGVDYFWGTPLPFSLYAGCWLLSIPLLFFWAGIVVTLFLTTGRLKSRVYDTAHRTMMALQLVHLPAKILTIKEDLPAESVIPFPIPPFGFKIINRVEYSSLASFNALDSSSWMSLVPLGFILFIALVQWTTREGTRVGSAMCGILVSLCGLLVFIPNQVLEAINLIRSPVLYGWAPAIPFDIIKTGMYLAVWFYFAVILLTVNNALLTITRRWPAVANILLIEPKKEQDISALTPKEAARADDLGIDESAMNSDGCIALYFFISNLVVCVLWYAFEYHRTGITNAL